MRTTIFSTPLLTPCLRLLAIGLLKLSGWKSVGKDLPQAKVVLIAAPHTSNWDFPIMVLVALKLRIKIYWMGKHSLFPLPVAWLMKWLGGIAIDRRKAQNMVQQTVAQYNRNACLVVLIPPEGTRSKVERWKTGFYHIAVNAKVPILLGYLDASKREAGLADFFYPSGDLEKDMSDIKAFYADKVGLREENS